MPDPNEKRCYRSCCRSPISDAPAFFNRSTRQLYCERCAVLLNRENKADAMRLYGGPLCVPAENIRVLCLAAVPNTGLDFSVVDENTIVDKCNGVDFKDESGKVIGKTCNARYKNGFIVVDIKVEPC